MPQRTSVINHKLTLNPSLAKRGTFKKLREQLVLAPSLFKRRGCPKESFGGDELINFLI
jgi:hypothetical protein